ncbi:hypothetical protein KCP73_11165 [Salmonella enterica subsp. enterica]|nr:hypothetical protein KCP73_11165 [Salmonella enterica subsp. enterica]
MPPLFPPGNFYSNAAFSGVQADSLVFAGGGSKGKLYEPNPCRRAPTVQYVPVVSEATALGGSHCLRRWRGYHILLPPVK